MSHHLKHSELNKPNPQAKRAAEAAEVRRENAENKRVEEGASRVVPDVPKDVLDEIVNASSAPWRETRSGVFRRE